MDRLGLLMVVILSFIIYTNSSSLNELIRNGTRLEWTYKRNGVTYYMTPDMTADAIDVARERFNVSTSTTTEQPATTDPTQEITTEEMTTSDPMPTWEGTPEYMTTTEEPLTTEEPTTRRPTTTEEATTRQPTTTEEPWYTYSTVEPTTPQIITDEPSTQSPIPELPGTIFQTAQTEYVSIAGTTLGKSNFPSSFLIVAVEGTENDFNLYYSGVSLVAPRARAPFDFVLRSQFPAEPAAIFSLVPYQFHLNTSYGGDRSKIISTLNEISIIDSEVERRTSFADLITQMIYFDHITNGSEIFIVGAFIKDSLSNYEQSFPFTLLPQQVQLVVKQPLQLSFIDTTGRTIPMSEHFGQSENVPIYPFLHDMLDYTYAIQSGKGSYWGIDPNSNDLISDSTASYEFTLHFPVNTTEFFYISNSAGFLNYGSTNGSVRTFCVCGLETSVPFVASTYEVNVAKMYDGQNRGAISEVAYLIRTYDDRTKSSEHFAELLVTMQNFNHIVGKDIFTVGAYMKESLVGMDPTYLMLPRTVRDMVAGDVTWSVEVGENGVFFDMKYSWASDLHEFIEPYSFQWDRANSTVMQFTIVYGAIANQKQEIFVNPITKELTQQIVSDGGLRYELEFTLRTDLNRFLIGWNGTLLGTLDQVPDFYFEANNQASTALFTVGAY